MLSYFDYLSFYVEEWHFLVVIRDCMSVGSFSSLAAMTCVCDQVNFLSAVYSRFYSFEEILKLFDVKILVNLDFFRYKSAEDPD